jgi:hypothetical protein
MKISHVLVVALLLAGCGDGSDGSSGRGGAGGPGDPNGAGAGADGGAPGSSGPQCATGGRPYTGFAGTDLVAARTAGEIGDDRRRVKPYTALATEYPRILGMTPQSLAAQAATFGAAPPRWFFEPDASAIGLYAAYSVAFEGCLATMASKPQYATAPTAATATSECTAMTALDWDRSATPDELSACTTLALTGLASEPDPHRRWAYVCAAVLTSDGFLTF